MASSDSTLDNQFEYTDNGHGQNILIGLYKQWKESVGLDLTLCITKRKIRAHRIVLMSFSQYFERLLGSNMRESHQDEIELHDLDGQTVEQLIVFAYTGKITITTENVQTLLETSDFLDVTSVCKACCEFMMRHIDYSNCVGLIQLADRLDLTQLKDEAETFFTDHFWEIKDTDDFLMVDINTLAEILAKDELCIVSRSKSESPSNTFQETLLLYAVMKYIEYSKTERCQFIVDLLKAVRLPQLTKDNLDLLMHQECVQQSEEALALVRDAKKHKLKISPGASNPWNRVRKYPGLQFSPSGCYANGGYVHPEIETFDHHAEMKDLKAHVTGMDIYIRRWDGRPVLGGLTVHYSNGKTIHNGGRDYGHETHSFSLEPNEYICEVVCRNGYMIDGLTFKTTKGRKLGRYGGPGGAESRSFAPEYFGYMSTVRGTVVTSQGTKGITRLCFSWAHYKYSSSAPPQWKAGQLNNNPAEKAKRGSKLLSKLMPKKK